MHDQSSNIAKLQTEEPMQNLRSDQNLARMTPNPNSDPNFYPNLTKTKDNFSVRPKWFLVLVTVSASLVAVGWWG